MLDPRMSTAKPETAPTQEMLRRGCRSAHPGYPKSEIIR